MSLFDDAWLGATEAEIAEMGVAATLKPDMDSETRSLMGVETDVEESYTQSVGGRRDRVQFSFFISAEDADEVEKGWVLEVDQGEGLDPLVGRVLTVVNMNGGGVELRCGPVSSWSGSIPGG